jgi:hypothetical protein
MNHIILYFLNDINPLEQYELSITNEGTQVNMNSFNVGMLKLFTITSTLSPFIKHN